MEQMRVIATIEQGADGGFTAWSEQVPGVYANGETEEEVRREFVEMMAEQADYMEQRTGDAPAWKGAEVEFRFNLSALFAAFPFLNVSAMAEWMGVNPSLMRKYKAGITVPRGRNREIIQQGLQRMAERLRCVNV